MGDYHEPSNELTGSTRDLVRAFHSFREEIEAIDWYQQRMTVCDDSSLREILDHNRKEEIEHAMMILEWLRRNDPAWDEVLRTYLFTTKPVVEIEEESEEEEAEGNRFSEDGSSRKGPLGARRNIKK